MFCALTLCKGIFAAETVVIYANVGLGAALEHDMHMSRCTCPCYQAQARGAVYYICHRSSTLVGALAHIV